ncbi:MAG: hypothetical protein PS018_17345 [bacterium]|nr:hypothetical protein [bacterium]
MLIAVAAALLLEAFDLNMNAGAGPIYAAIFVFIAVSVGACEAWRSRRGVVGWIVSITASALGCFLAIGLLGFGMEAVIARVQWAIPPQILNYVVAAVGTGFIVSGAWLPVKIVGLLRGLWRT